MNDMKQVTMNDEELASIIGGGCNPKDASKTMIVGGVAGAFTGGIGGAAVGGLGAGAGYGLTCWW